MNLNCKAIFNINIVNFLIIYVAIDFTGNHIEEINNLKKKNKLIINF
jgi:hypothetical protein